MRRIVLLLAGLLLVRAPARVEAGDGDPAPAAPDFSEPQGDPDGEATRLDREAAALLSPPQTGDAAPAAPPDAVGAANAWMALAERDPEASLPAPIQARGAGGGGTALWPAREVALARLAALPEAGLAAVEARWGPLARAALEADAAESSLSGLARAAREWPVTEAGAAAALLLAERDLEAGRAAPAVRALERWLRLAPAPSRARRASVAVRLLDARAMLDDERGVAEVVERLAPLGSLAVPRGDGATTLAARAAEATREIRARRGARAASEAEGPPVPASPLLLWSRTLRDPGLVGEPPTEDLLPAASAAYEDGALYVAEERRVSRLDPETGLVRWTFPQGDLPRDVALAARVAPRRLPIRPVVPAGRRVFAVLGDPPAGPTSTFWFRSYGSADEWMRPEEHGRETRARLVALDARTGELEWLTGRPEETHPVLGARDVAVTSPPLVAGDVVYVVLSARRGAVESWLAALDVGTGRPRFVTFLARGESGLDPAESPGERVLLEEHARTVPPAQVPALAGGALCVVPGAGYVASVDATDGRLLWVRALPRWRLAQERPDLEDRDPAPAAAEPPPAGCHSLRNAPVAVAGAWVVAATDSSHVCAVDAATGALRWTARPASGPREGVLLPHLFGATADADGGAWIRCAGGARSLALLDAATGREGAAPTGLPSPGPAAPGRPFGEGNGLVAWREGALRPMPWPRSGAGAGRGAGVPTPQRALFPDAPEGDVVRASDVWIVVAHDRVLAVADEATARAQEEAAGRDAADDALRACRRAAREPSLASLRRAADAAAAVRHPSVDAALADAAGKALGGPRLAADSPEDLLALLATTDRLPAALRAPLHLRVGRALAGRGEHAALVALLADAATWGAETLVDVDGSGRTSVRFDRLAAHEWVGRAAASPAGREALAAREETARRAVEEAGDDGAALEAAVGRHVGTWAAWVGRLRLFALHAGDARFGDAARDLADARLDRPAGTPLPLACAASLRASEAECLRRAGERDAAREALFDARTSAGPFAAALGGALAGPLEEAWRAADDLVPAKDVEVAALRPWGPEAEARPERAALSLLAPSGPGAGPDLDVALLARGGELETWSLEAIARTGAVAVEGAMSGLRVLDREPFVPGPGVLVSSVVAGAGADRAGLRAGDWIVSWNGAAAADSTALLRAIAGTPVGHPAPVLARRRGAPLALEVTSGGRPTDERSRLAPRCAWFDGAGGAIVPARYGLLRLDLATGTTSPRWSWTGPGDVTRATVRAGTFLLHAGANAMGGGVLVAVDAADGRELWRAPVPGILPRDREPRATGSAVMLDLETPAETWVLDARTGRPRARYDRSDPIRLAGPSAGVPVEPTAAAVGCVHLLQTTVDASGPLLVAVNTSTGSPVWSREVPFGSGSRLYPPLLAGGSVVALALVPSEILVFVPDLLGQVSPALPLSLPELKWNYNSNFGPLDRDSRLVVRGDTVYLLRAWSQQRVTISALEVDRERLGPSSGGPDPVLWHAPRYLLPTTASADGVRSRPVILAAWATLDGAWATATFDTPTPDAALEGRVSWFDTGRDDLFAWFRAPAHVASPALRPRLLDGPARVGRRLLAPTDGGFLVVPLVPRSHR